MAALSFSGFDLKRSPSATFIDACPPDGRVVARRVYVAPAEAWDGRDYARLAALLSGDVAGLGGVIASALPAGM